MSLRARALTGAALSHSLRRSRMGVRWRLRRAVALVATVKTGWRAGRVDGILHLS